VTCDRTAKDQGMDVVGAFIGVHGLQVRHHAHDVVLVNDTVATKHVTSNSGNVEGLATIVALDH